MALTELRFARAVFVKHDAGGKLKVILALHVDDGLVFGTRSDPIYGRLRQLITSQLDINNLGDLNNPDGVDYLRLMTDMTWTRWNRWKYQRSKPFQPQTAFRRLLSHIR